MNEELDQLLQLAVSSSSANTYRTGQRQFVRFCHSIGAHHLPATKKTVALFAAHLGRSVSPSTIKVYLAAVSLSHRQAGLSSPSRHNPALRLALRGLTRRQAGTIRHVRAPITTGILQLLIRTLHLAKPWCYLERSMLAAALCLGFYGFLRGGELMPPNKHTFNPRTHPTSADINLSAEGLRFLIKRSKTDQLGRGHTISLFRSTAAFCPVAIIENYLARHNPSPDRPLFLHCDGTPVYIRQFRAMLRELLSLAGLPPDDYNTHSLRIGAATSAAKEGVSAKVIKKLGRWRSRTYKLYIRN